MLSTFTNPDGSAISCADGYIIASAGLLEMFTSGMTGVPVYDFEGVNRPKNTMAAAMKISAAMSAMVRSSMIIQR